MFPNNRIFKFRMFPKDKDSMYSYVFSFFMEKTLKLIFFYFQTLMVLCIIIHSESENIS